MVWLKIITARAGNQLPTKRGPIRAVCPADGRLVTLAVTPFDAETFQVFLGLLLRHARPNRKMIVVVDEGLPIVMIVRLGHRKNIYRDFD